MMNIPAVGRTRVLAMDMEYGVWEMRYGEWADVMQLAAIRALSPHRLITSNLLPYCLIPCQQAVF